MDVNNKTKLAHAAIFPKNTLFELFLTVFRLGGIPYPYPTPEGFFYGEKSLLILVVPNGPFTDEIHKKVFDTFFPLQFSIFKVLDTFLFLCFLCRPVICIIFPCKVFAMVASVAEGVEAELLEVKLSLTRFIIIVHLFKLALPHSDLVYLTSQIAF